jgi:mitoferrin-2
LSISLFLLFTGAAGCLATILHDAVMNPAEVIKQRLQMYNSPYTNVYSCALQIWKKEGVRAFYRSYLTQVTMNIPFQSFHLITYEYMQELTNPQRTYNATTHVISGAVAGSIAGAITTPLDVCKTLLNTQDARTLSASRQSHIRGLLHAVCTVYTCCGLRGFFNGLQARVMHTLPATTICWSVYEFFKHVYQLKL